MSIEKEGVVKGKRIFNEQIAGHLRKYTYINLFIPNNLLADTAMTLADINDHPVLVPCYEILWQIIREFLYHLVSLVQQRISSHELSESYVHLQYRHIKKLGYIINIGIEDHWLGRDSMTGIISSWFKKIYAKSKSRDFLKKYSQTIMSYVMICERTFDISLNRDIPLKDISEKLFAESDDDEYINFYFKGMGILRQMDIENLPSFFTVDWINDFISILNNLQESEKLGFKIGMSTGNSGEMGIFNLAIQDYRYDVMRILIDGRITNEREIAKYWFHLRSNLGILASCNPQIKTMMQRLYKHFCFGKNAIRSLVGGHIYEYYINILKLKKTISFEGIDYETYRFNLMKSIFEDYDVRYSSIEILMLMLENTSCVYDTSAKLFPNLWITGDKSSGKDFLLELVQSIRIPETMIKETRHSDFADSIESHGRNDDEVVFTSEKSVEPTKGGGSKLNNLKKDQMTSHEVVTRTMVFDRERNIRIRTVLKNERRCMMYDVANQHMTDCMDQALADRYIWIRIPKPYAIIPNSTPIESSDTINDIESDAYKKLKRMDDCIYTERIFQSLIFFTYKMIAAGIKKEPNTQASELLMRYINTRLKRDFSLYGCREIETRCINAIQILAKFHAIKRNIFNLWKASYPEIPTIDDIANMDEIRVTASDLILSLGGLSKFLNIMPQGEIFVLYCMRRIWLQKIQALSFTYPNYARFPRNPEKMLTKIKLMLSVLDVELKDITLPNDDVIKFAFKNLCSFYSQYYVYREYEGWIYIKDLGVVVNNRLMSMDKRKILKLIKYKSDHVYIHISLLMRLFDTKKNYMPWTMTEMESIEKRILSINERTLLNRYINDFFSHKHQHENYMEKQIYICPSSENELEEVKITPHKEFFDKELDLSQIGVYGKTTKRSSRINDENENIFLDKPIDRYFIE